MVTAGRKKTDRLRGQDNILFLVVGRNEVAALEVHHRLPAVVLVAVALPLDQVFHLALALPMLQDLFHVVGLHLVLCKRLFIGLPLPLPHHRGKN